jgi:hypothetical protein
MEDGLRPRTRPALRARRHRPPALPAHAGTRPKATFSRRPGSRLGGNVGNARRSSKSKQDSSTGRQCPEAAHPAVSCVAETIDRHSAGCAGRLMPVPKLARGRCRRQHCRSGGPDQAYAIPNLHRRFGIQVGKSPSRRRIVVRSIMIIDPSLSRNDFTAGIP